ncbi:hypothetical protein [Ralstonia solanacearum]|uniref:hypothetical protein n=1 Tax=Ralstonia solanacearum TaxID=305 RepID=UPI0012D459FE|nr:hypothetical protein [Ralstonia solanacearum]MDC6212488.1 hypothetical protein [Ralstonia solanacearum]MDC6241356.1 hypothetical protein [Ralstonia solanacearum]
MELLFLLGIVPAAKMPTLSDDEYEGLKRFMGLFYEWFEAKPHYPPEMNPVAVLEDLEKKSRAQAKRGLKMAINDCLEMSGDWTPQQVSDADGRFLEHGAPSLSELRRSQSKKYLSLLKRGRVTSLVDYYFLKGVVDGGGVDISSEEGKKLVSMLSTYEQSAPKE